MIALTRETERLLAPSEERDGWTFSDRLHEAGFTSAEVRGIEELIEQEAARRGREESGRFVAWLADRLRRHSAAGAALAAVLAPNEETLADLAVALGTSKQNLGNYLPALRALLPEVAAVHGRARPVPKPEAPGDWMTRPQIRALFGISPDRLARMQIRREIVGQTMFVDRASVQAALAAEAIAAAAQRLAEAR